MSSQHPDHSPDRLVEDVVAFARSIGEPVGLMDWGTVLWAPVAAQHPEVVFAIAAYEPGANETMSGEMAARFVPFITRVGELVAEGRLVDASRTFIEGSDIIYSDEDLASGKPADFWAAAAPNLPVFFQEQQLADASEASGATDPATLANITVPALLLHGTGSRPWFIDSVRHVAGHLPDAHVREIPGAGHFGPHTHPEPVAEEVASFFATAA